MTADDVTRDLESIASTGDFAAKSADLVERWSASGAGVEMVEPILQFMAKHPSIEYGVPGPLVHFVERFHGKGYQEKLVDSVERTPTFSTIWMLNRVLNGTKVPETRHFLIAVMEKARRSPVADTNTLQLIDRFLGRVSK